MATADLAFRGPEASDPPRQIGVYVGQLLTGELANKILRFAATVVLARALTTSEFGLVNVGIAISGIALVASSLGLPDLGSREAAIDPQRAGWLAGHVAAARLLVLSAITVVGLALSLVVWPGHMAFLIVAAVMAMFMAVSGDWLARGLEHMSLAAGANAVGGLTVLAGSLVVTELSADATAALAAFAIAEGAVAAMLWTRLHRRRHVEFGLGGMGSMLRRARPLAFSSLAIYFYYANLDTIILAASHSDRDAGLYSAPYRLFLVLNLVAVFAGYAMLPMLSRLADSNLHADADRLVATTLTALAGYGLMTLGLVELVGEDALRLLFGSQFRAASGTFILLAAGVAWYSTGYPAGYSLVARGENARFLRGAATAGVLSVALDIALIPPLGMRGAGLATMLAFMSAGLVWLSTRGLLVSGTLPIVAALGVTTAAAIVVVFLHGPSAVAGVATGTMAILLQAQGLPITAKRVRGRPAPGRGNE